MQHSIALSMYWTWDSSQKLWILHWILPLQHSSGVVYRELEINYQGGMDALSARELAGAVKQLMESWLF